MLRVIMNNEMRRTTTEVVVACFLVYEHFREGLREDVKTVLIAVDI
jgi:hypothetical protein